MKRSRILLFAGCVLLLTFLFYWLLIRPSNIRRECYSYVQQNGLYEASEIEKQAVDWERSKFNDIENKRFQEYY